MKGCDGMSDIMLLGVLRMPLPDEPAELNPIEWLQIKDRMRQAADELEQLRRELDEARTDAEWYRERCQMRVDERDEARRECEEQARLLGMSAERELALREALQRVQTCGRWITAAKIAFDAIKPPNDL